MSYFFLALAIIIEIIATILLKTTEGFLKPLPSIATLIAYGFCFYSFSLSLRTIPIGVAYAIWAGIGTIGICLLGWIMYQQKLSLMMMVGIVMIIVGVGLINMGGGDIHR